LWRHSAGLVAANNVRHSNEKYDDGYANKLPTTDMITTTTIATSVLRSDFQLILV